MESKRVGVGGGGWGVSGRHGGVVGGRGRRRGVDGVKQSVFLARQRSTTLYLL